MARLTTAARNALPTTAFAVPGQRAFPIQDVAHARNALARVAGKSAALKAQVRAAVRRKFPAVGKG